jgi:UDP-N-acetylglucosamine--N-acetylmuramyl-(pentapeptide) pyrophosphoryl-undecaprenol N-acetylglucosamine transferase
VTMTIVCAGGGTGGHVFPGIAVIDHLRQMESNSKLHIVWIGSGKEIERKIIGRFEIPYYAVPAGKLRRYFSLQNFLDVFKIGAGIVASLVLLKRLKADVLFSKGGYAAVAPVIAARILKIPIITHESDRDPGLATRIAARFADRILLPYQTTLAEYYPRAGARALVPGNPVRAELFSGDPAHGRDLLKVPENEPIVLVLGGSQGARQVNQLLAEVLPQLLQEAVVVHQMGQLDFQASQEPRYITADIFHSEFPHILAAADLIISRAGAGTLWESGVLGKPSLLIPLGGESSRGDQVRNARLFAERGAAVVLEGSTLTPAALLEHTRRLLRNKNEREAMGRAAAELCPADAAGRIAELIYTYAVTRKGEP